MNEAEFRWYIEDWRERIEERRIEREFKRQERRAIEKFFRHLALIGLGFVVLITVMGVLSVIF